MPDKTISPLVAIVVAMIGFLGSIGAAYLTAESKAQDTTRKEIASTLLDQKTGAIVGEIRAFAFGGERNEDAIKELRKLGWLECAGQAIAKRDYERLYKVLSLHPWGTKSGGLVTVPDLRGMFLRGWSHGADMSKEVASERDARLPPDKDRTGATGNHVGSFQKGQLELHSHGPVLGGPARGPFLPRADQWQTNQPGDGGAWSMSMAASGGPAGAETVPNNVFVLYCIYTGSPIKDETEDGSTR